ncbi:MAG: glycosyltransferase family 87 protein [Candidatus Sulfotelmatobacter sp.]
MGNRIQPANSLTPKRLRAHGFILALCLWSVYLWNIATPGLFDRAGNLKGTDFLHFYTLGSLALAHRGADLYNLQAQSELAAQRVPAAAGIRYLPLYPPQVSIFFAPFARLSYAWALVLWLALSALIYALCCYAVWRACPNLRNHQLIIFLLALGFPAFWHLIAWGQTSALALACFTLAFFALRAQREFLAGLALGCLIFKPQLGLAAAIVFLLTFRWKIVSGALLSAAVELTSASLYYGPGPLREWMRVLLNASRMLPLLEPRLYQTHSLRTFWTMLFPWPAASFALYVVSALLVSGLAIACWRSRSCLSLRYSALLLATVLLAPHLTVYDLVILAPAFLLLSDWIGSQPENDTPNIKLLLYLTLVLPLLGPFARWTHVQLSVLVMAALLYGIWKLGGKSVPVANSV